MGSRKVQPLICSLLVGFVALLLPCRAILAEETHSNYDTFRLTGYLGQFDANPEPQFVGARNEYALGVVLGVDQAKRIHLNPAMPGSVALLLEPGCTVILDGSLDLLFSLPH